jgi:hypothetical protein
MPQVSDTRLFRKAFLEAGFRQANKEAPLVFNDKRKSGIRRLKLWDGDPVFAAPPFAQQDLDWAFKNRFGDRYLGGEFIAHTSWYMKGKKAFVVYLLTA